MAAFPEVGWSALLGTLVGATYTATSIFVIWLSRRTDRFVVVVFGGMVLRMIATLVLLVLIFLYVPVVIPAFAGTFLCVFLAGMIAEIAWLLKRGK